MQHPRVVNFGCRQIKNKQHYPEQDIPKRTVQFKELFKVVQHKTLEVHSFKEILKIPFLGGNVEPVASSLVYLIIGEYKQVE